MTRFILRWAINAVALYAAIILVDGIQMQSEGWMSIIWLALIFGLVNAVLRPVLHALTCLLNAITLGLFVLVTNTLLFWLSGVIGLHFGVGFTVDGFWSAFVGALIVSVVSLILGLVLQDELKRR